MNNNGNSQYSEIQMEKLVSMISQMDRDELSKMLRSLQCEFKLDFTDDFLATVSIERFRHILIAAALHANNVVRQPA